MPAQEYEFVSITDQLVILNNHIAEIERELFSLDMNIDRAKRTKDFYNEDQMKQATTQLEGLQATLESAHAQRDEVLGQLSSRNGNKPKKAAKK